VVVAVDTSEGPLRMVSNPIRFQDAAAAYRPPPRLHEHTDEVLGETKRAPGHAS
jgi:crotonobetainyl-CoA:carnitine CoA-transferase CaiB-like acyl-CoA transferase